MWPINTWFLINFALVLVFSFGLGAIIWFVETMIAKRQLKRLMAEIDREWT